MNVTVVGAGNIGLAITGYMASHEKGHIKLFTKKNILKNGKLIVKDNDDAEYLETDNFVCTSNLKDAFEDADVILITYPAFLRKEFIKKCEKYIKKGSFLGFVPGYGGIEYSCVSLIDKGVNIFGFQRVPYVARLTKENEKNMANILSKKNKLFIGSIPNSKTKNACEIIENLLDIPVQPLIEYLAITLAPTNPLLHITGLYNVFGHCESSKIFDKKLMFYEEWNDEASRILLKYDRELQEICRKIHSLDMREVVSLSVYYESFTSSQMTHKLKSIKAFETVEVPLIETDKGYVPDLNSRMFIEDFPFGICVIKDFALMLGIKTPVVDFLLKFYEKFSGHKYFEEDGSYTKEIQNTGVPGINGLTTIDKIIEFYQVDHIGENA